MPINPFSNRNAYTPDNPSMDTDPAEEVGLDEFELEDEDIEEDEYEENNDIAPYGVDGHYENLTHYFNDEELDKLGKRIIEHVKDDENSRKTWMDHAITGLKLLGLNLGAVDNSVTSGNCTATHPLILETAVKFQSKASTELLPANGPAQVRIWGIKTEEKIKRAGRVKQHLNYQLTEQMTEFYSDSEKNFLFTAIFGSGFKKAWFDPDKRRPVDVFVPVHQFVVSNNATDLENAERYTYVDPVSERTVKNRMESGFYKEYPILDKDDTENSAYSGNSGEGMGASGTLSPYTIDLGAFARDFNDIIGVSSGQTSEGFVLYEHYCYYDFKDKPELKDDFGRKIPYIITVEQESGKVLSIRRGWSEDDELEKKREEYFTKYGYIPSFGFYDFGLIHILGNWQLVMTSLLRSLVDAGQFANLQGGFKKKGPRITGPTDTFQNGEYRDVEVAPGESIRDVILPHMFKEPSAVVQAMLQYLDGRGTDFANATDQVLQGSTNYGPVGTTMALLEAAGKMYAAIYKRFHKAQSKELKIIARLNYQFMDEDEAYPFDIKSDKEDGIVYREDYDPKTVDVCPVSDPNVSSQAHRIALANAKMDAAIQAKGVAPELAVNFPYILKNYMLELDPQEDEDMIFIPNEEAKPLDPLSDLKVMLDGKPIKAFPGQDHQAHILFKQAWLSDPDQGASKPMQQFSPQVLANIREHMLMGYQERIGAMATGAATDKQTFEMLQAQAAQELAKMSQALKTQDSPENKVADAVLMEAKVKAAREEREAKSEKFDQLLNLVEKFIGLSREQNRAAEADSKVDTAQLSQLKDFILAQQKIEVEKEKVRKPK
jgi:hypothetical protein